MKRSLRIVGIGLLAVFVGAAACAGGGSQTTQGEAGQPAPGPMQAPPGSAQTSQGAAQPAQQPGAAMSGGMMGRGGMMERGGMMMGAPADTSAAPQARAIAATAPGCPQITQALVDTGRQIFAGPGNCFSCHGSNARGTALAPNLADATWLDADGSYVSILGVVRAGVPQPKQSSTPMPPMGGAQLDSAQVCAVSAYVFSLGH